SPARPGSRSARADLPQPPVHRVPGTLRGEEPVDGLLLLSPELLVLLLVPDVEALASSGIGIDVLPLPVLRLRQHLSWRQRLELRELVRSVGRPRLEAGGREGLLGGVRVGALQSRTSGQAHGAQQSNE